MSASREMKTKDVDEGVTAFESGDGEGGGGGSNRVVGESGGKGVQV